MKTRFLNIALLASALGVFALAANAQSPIARANVPFEFAAGGAMMPPGEYTVHVPVSGVIVLRGSSNNSVTLLTVASGLVAPSGAAKLVFERRDGMAFFAGVDSPSETVRLVPPFMNVPKAATTAALR
jgi:hypothetical protein